MEKLSKIMGEKGMELLSLTPKLWERKAPIPNTALQNYGRERQGENQESPKLWERKASPATVPSKIMGEKGTSLSASSKIMGEKGRQSWKLLQNYGRERQFDVNSAPKLWERKAQSSIYSSKIMGEKGISSIRTSPKLWERKASPSQPQLQNYGRERQWPHLTPSKIMGEKG